jgi:hypothetical protein
MKQHGKRWMVAELVPPILLGLVGLMILLAAPTRPPASVDSPKKTPRLSPTKPPSANRMLHA